MSRNTRSRWPSLWVAILWLVELGALAWFWFSDMGDEGLRNVFSMVAVALALVTGWIWFVLFSGWSRAARLATAVVTVALVAAFVATFRLEGFSGAMIPQLSSRYGGEDRVEERLVATASTDSRADLKRTGPSDFPGFLGAKRDAFVPGVRLATDWETRPPELLWRARIGAGWSGFAIVGGVGVTLEQRDGEELASAWDVASGERLWERVLSDGFELLIGGDGPRSTPTLDEGRVYVLGATGKLACLDGADGSVIWSRDLLADFSVSREAEERNVLYGRSNSPLVHGELVIVPAGGDGERRAGLVAYDKLTGEVRWEGPGRQISFASPNVATLGGVEQILIVNEDTVTGHDPRTGALLFEEEWPGRTSADASVSQAVPVPPDRVLLSKGYGGGSMLLELGEPANGTFAPRVVWRNRRTLRTKFSNVVLADGYVWGLSDGRLECVELETGERMWKEGSYGYGQLLRVGDLLLVTTEYGDLVLVELDPSAPNEVLGRVPVLEGKCWSTPALWGAVLVVRNATEAAAFRLPLVLE